MGNVVISGRFGCKDEGIAVCKILKRVEKVSSDTQALVFTLYRQMVSGVLWQVTLKGEVAQ